MCYGNALLSVLMFFIDLDAACVTAQGLAKASSLCYCTELLVVTQFILAATISCSALPPRGGRGGVTVLQRG